MHTALVTGAASGIGRALARALLAQGSTVVVADLDGAAAQRTAAELGPHALAAQVDVREREAVRELVERTDRDHDGLDLLVNNAGTGVGGAFSMSLALRAEAATHGVRVSVLCPGFTQTPLLDRAHMAEAPTGVTSIRPLITAARARTVPPEPVARDCLAGLRRDRAIIVTPLSARVMWRAFRLAPGLADALATRTARDVLASLPTAPAPV